jgi:nucleoid-associated protein YejK
MDSILSVEFVALHLVDRQQPGPKYCKKAFSLEDFKDPDDRAVLEKFFNQHLSDILGAEESKRTRAAVFKTDSKLQAYFNKINQDPECFYPISREIATHLYESSAGTTASPGVLLIIWVRNTEDKTPYLVLLKLDPSQSDLVGLEHNPDGSLLLDLAVHHIDLTLPASGERVLKWAILPHPNRPGLDVKVKDEQGRADTAQYFMNFIGCTERSSQKEQSRGLLEALTVVAEACHPDVDVKPIVQGIVEELVEEKIVSPEVVLQKVEESGELPNFQEQAFREKLDDTKSSDLHIDGKSLTQTRLEYHLSNGIIIRGNWAAVENLVDIKLIDDGGFEFVIRTPKYEKKYV